MFLQKLSFANILQNRSSLKCLNIHRKTPVLDSISNKVAGQHRSFPVNVANFLISAFFTEHLRWLLLYLLEREEEESVKQWSEEKLFK